MRLGLLVSTSLSVVVSAFGASARAQGVPQDGFPNWQERTLWVFVNRDRADPETALESCDAGCPDAVCYEGPKPPLAYNLQLSHSARLQPTLLAENNVPLMHPSPCVLNPDIAKTYPEECDGGKDCVCQTPVQCSNPFDTQTCSCSEDTSDTSKFEDPFARISLFAPGATYYAENLAAGQPDPQQVESGWLLEDCSCCAADTCGSTDCTAIATGPTNGHRYNLMNTTENSIGLGAVKALPGDCTNTFPAGYYWGQDFAFFENATVLKIVAGSHFPENGTSIQCPGEDGGASCLQFSFYANWFDPLDGAPGKATVVIDSQAHAMTVDRGSGGNASYVYPATLVAGGCHAYTFAFTDSSGNSVTLPVSGNYLAGDKCTTDYSAGGGGCTTGAGEPWFGGLLLAAGLLRREVKRRRRPPGPRNWTRKLTKWQ